MLICSQLDPVKFESKAQDIFIKKNAFEKCKPFSTGYTMSKLFSRFKFVPEASFGLWILVGASVCLCVCVRQSWVYLCHKGTFEAHLHYIRDLGPSIRVRAQTQSKQVNWCFVFTLIRVRVRDFCLGRPCPSLSLHVAISSDADVWVRPRLWNTHAQSRLFTWSLPNLVQNGRGLGWPRIRASDVV